MTAFPAEIDVENVVVLVGDAVRYDYAEDQLANYGATYKTVAASLHTPTSFATMLSGKRPTKHGVYGFHQQLDTDDHLFGLPGYDTAFHDGETESNEWLASQQAVFGEQPQRSLSEMEPPFVFVDRDFGGHAPYNRYTNDGERGDDGLSHGDYFKEYAGENDYLREQYDRSVTSWLERVQDLIHTLEKRGIRDETLVVLCSDHGELLGEHGQVGHDYPATPELVYVPMTFVHPDIEPGRVRDGVARHIDLVPTLLDALGESFDADVPGQALQQTGTVEYGVSYYNRALNDYLTRIDGAAAEWLPDVRVEIESVWDRDGGYVFNRSSTPKKLLLYGFRTVALPHGRSIIRQRAFKDAYDTLVPSVSSYGTPGFDEETADELAREHLSGKVSGSYEYDLDDEAESQLEDLGYM